MTTIAETLRSLPYFADLDQHLLDAVCAEATEIRVEAGTAFLEEGSQSEEMYVIADGLVRVVKQSGGHEIELARLGSGEVVGEIALLDAAPRTATVVAERDSVLIEVPVAAFEMLLADPDVIRRMFRTVTARLRSIEMTLRHEERMAALGRMAAQLMHELNNPAAAVGRSSQQLAEVTVDLNTLAITLTKRLTGGADLEPPDTVKSLSPLERSEMEDDVAGLLDELGVAGAWELAPAMIAAGWSSDSLSEALEEAEDDLRADLARWTGLRASAAELISEIGLAASRVSELVRIVKDYSYLDQAPVQDVDIIKGIEDTLTLLKHELRDIEVVTEFDEDLPTVEAPGRDLNQVWMNLIDNAADAMKPGGVLTVTASVKDQSVVVNITDTGGGIPADIADRVFDPFFTTKEPGKGTGLGLHTVYTIVSRLGGEIEVEPTGGGTTFTVELPLS